MKTEYLAQVAHLISCGFTQGEAAGMLGLSKNDAHLLVMKATALGLLHGPFFSKEAFFRLWPNPQSRISLENLCIGLKLLQGLTDSRKKDRSDTLRQVKVIPSISDDTTPEGWSFRLCDFGRQVLPDFFAVLSEAGVCDIGWGGTIGAIVSTAEREGLPERLSHLTLVSTCGELFDYLDFSNASSGLVERIHLVLKKKQTAFTLRGVPALLDNSDLREFYLRKHPGYRAIFGPEGLAGRADAAIISVGTFEQKGVHAFKRALVAEWGVAEKRLRDISWGDLGGVLVPRNNHSAEGKKEFDRISSLWTGITLAHYRELAKRAGEPPTKKAPTIPGVVVFAIGENKAEIIHEIVKAGLVNRIVIDLDLAKALATRANIDLAEGIRSPYRPDHHMVTVQEVIATLDHLTDKDKDTVRESLRKTQ